MTGKNRLQREFEEILKTKSDNMRDLDVTDNNSLIWKCVLLPQSDPYKNGAFKVELNFPVEYPFKPPEIRFLTRIYHPNIDEKGRICLPIISAENWKPATKIESILQELMVVLDEPDQDNPLRADLADEYKNNREKFNENADNFTREFADRR